MIRFGSLELKSNLFLSPLAGYTNLPFRLVIREIGGVDLCTTEHNECHQGKTNRDRVNENDSSELNKHTSN